MQEVTSLSQILSLVAAGASVLLALVALALSGLFFFMTTRLNHRAQESAGRVENSTSQLSKLYDWTYREWLGEGQTNQQESGQPPPQTMEARYPLPHWMERG